MRAVRDRADAAWLPSRFHFALFRLLAFLILGASRSREHRGLVLILDRYQNAIETYAVSVWIVITAACYTGFLLAAVTHPIVAAVVAIPLAVLVIELLLAVIAGVATLAGFTENNIQMNSVVFMAVMIAISGWLATKDEWIRFVAGAFLVLTFLNGVAAVAVRLLDARFRRLEQQYGAGT